MVFAVTDLLPQDSEILLEPESATVSAGFWAGYSVFVLSMVIIAVVAYWKLFKKAGVPGWYGVVPFLNSYTLFRISGRNGLWLFGLLVPLLNIFVGIRLALELAQNFGKSATFGVVALWLFSPIGLLILGMGDAKYVGKLHQ